MYSWKDFDIPLTPLSFSMAAQQRRETGERTSRPVRIRGKTLTLRNSFGIHNTNLCGQHYKVFRMNRDSSRTNLGGRIPASLQAVFLSSNSGHEVYTPPPSNVAFKSFSYMFNPNSRRQRYEKVGKKGSKRAKLGKQGSKKVKLVTPVVPVVVKVRWCYVS
jgi:hypothetical protein